MSVVYLLFNEGYSATSGDDWMRTELCAEAVRLARILAALVPSAPEAHGLVALLELQHSRAEFERAASLTSNHREKTMLLQRAVDSAAR